MSSWNEISDSWGSLPANIYTWAVQPYAEDVGFSMATLLTGSSGIEYRSDFIFDMGVSAEVNRDFTFRNSTSVSLCSGFTEIDSFIGRDSVSFSVESQFIESNVMIFPEVSSFDSAVNYLMSGSYSYNVPVSFDFVADVDEVERDFIFSDSTLFSLEAGIDESNAFTGIDSVGFAAESQFTESNVMTFPESFTFDLAVSYTMRGVYGYNVPVSFDFVADVVAVNNIVAEYSQDFSSASGAEVSNYNYMQEGKLFGFVADVELEVLSWGRVKPVIGSWSSENSQEGGWVSEGSTGDGWQSIPPL
jgi:hypothetical protein